MSVKTGLAHGLDPAQGHPRYCLLLVTLINCPEVKQPAISGSDLGKNLLHKWVLGFTNPLKLSHALIHLRRLAV